RREMLGVEHGTRLDGGSSEAIVNANLPVVRRSFSPLLARRGRGYQVLSGGEGARGYLRLGALPWALWHLVALGRGWSGVSPRALVVFAIGYVLRILGVTVAYHRYFAHRTFRTSRAFQFVLALLAETTAQKGILWYASHHRHHHRCA